MDVNECYDALGLDPGSSDAQIKAAWRRLAAQWHPDRNASPEALRHIQRINRALDEIRRSRAQADGGADEDDAASAGPVVEHPVSVSLEEVLTGCARELRGEVVAACGDCEGSGLQAEPARCSECDGAGRVRPHLWFGWLSPMLECGACQGHGATRQGCASCGGSGNAPARKYRCRVDIPRGSRAGDVLDVVARVQARDRKHTVALRVRVQLRPHELFEAEPDGTVRCDVPVDGFAWIANRWIDVPTPGGLQHMKLQRGATSYRIKEAGLPWQADGARADCIVNVVPLFPEALNAQQDAAIDRLVASNTGAARTAAGEQCAAWSERIQAWESRLNGQAKGQD
ncbi:MAG TPA: DnaJ domain-containing protein [Ramlibacter sp.]|nr:DnaJ domain-containing protein [Ramlibacter sp.]